jgi:hypothetical protein
MDRVHVDEKWLWLCQDGEKYILLEDEPPPKLTTKHKNYIEKVMFLSVLKLTQGGTTKPPKCGMARLEFGQLDIGSWLSGQVSTDRQVPVCGRMIAWIRRGTVR